MDYLSFSFYTTGGLVITGLGLRLGWLVVIHGLLDHTSSSVLLNHPPGHLLGNMCTRFYQLRRETPKLLPTGGKGVYNQWIHCDLIVIFQAIYPARNQWIYAEFF